MNANELMLGNYVEFNETIYKVLAIKSGFMQVAYKSEKGNFIVSWIDNDSLNPIPLTEQWLLDFGFEMYEFDNKANQFRFKERLIVYRDGFLYDYGTSVKLEYVHQLQNLYFALTGNSLRLVEPK